MMSTQPTCLVPTEEEEMVRRTAADFVADRLPVQALRRLRDSHQASGMDAQVWRETAELGWMGIAVSERFGGSGLGIRALSGVIEELGKTLAALPLTSTALVAATVIERFADSQVAERWLPAIARGEVIAALAVHEGPHSSEPILDTAIMSTPDGPRLDGSKTYIGEAAAADLLLVAARHRDGPLLALVRADEVGVIIHPVETIDSRGLAEISFDEVPVDALLAARNGRDPVAYAEDCARIGLAAEMLGAAGRAFDLTLDYLRTRRQFGQLIGSFQALQHRAAKLFIELELTRSCVLAAVDSLHHDRADLPMLASLAKASAGELMRTMSYEMIQLHGGIGMTDAHDAGLYLKRGRVASLLHGDAAFHVDRYAALKGY